MSKDTLTESRSKFTKGEKCIFSHLIVTFTFILIMIIIYGIHLYMVKHALTEIFSTRRSSFETKRKTGSDNLLVGYLYVNDTMPKFACNTLLLKERWSLCTSHCVTIRSDPDMAHLLFSWRLNYKLTSSDVADQESAAFITPIKRSIAHPLFDRETFANNVGLLEHTQPYPIQTPNFNNAVVTSNSQDRNNMFIISWNHSETDITGNLNIKPFSYKAQLVRPKHCMKALSPVTIVRSYEFCVRLQSEQQIYLDYGAVVFVNSKVLGIFSWGERLEKELPLVILNISFFQHWLNIITAS